MHFDLCALNILVLDLVDKVDTGSVMHKSYTRQQYFLEKVYISIKLLIVGQQKCIECGDTFIGRLDKKFCGDSCRSAYNNRLNSDRNNYIRNINNILRRNRRIMAQLNPEGKTKVHKDQLLAQGFNFTYYTNQYITKAGKVYHFCYDQGYLELPGGYYALVERQPYVG